MNLAKYIALALMGFFLVVASTARAQQLRIVTDIAPTRAIVADITGQYAVIEQLIPATQSPHDYALKPSDMRKLQQADMIIWQGSQATPALRKILSAPRYAAKLITLDRVEGTVLLQQRRPGLFAGQQVDLALPMDAHTWLEPKNVTRWSRVIADSLAAKDDGNGTAYRENAARLRRDIAASTQAIRTRFAVVSPRPYVQFHDAFQYFEAAFGLTPLGAATVADEGTTSLGQMRALRQALGEAGPGCVFIRELSAKRAGILLGGTDARLGYLDAVGLGLSTQGFTYIELLSYVADGFAGCLLP